MKDQQSIVIARAQVGVMLRRLGEYPGRDGADVDPRKRAALSGMYAALCWVLGIPNDPARQMELLVGGRAGDPLPPPGALDLTGLRAKPKED